MATVIIPAHNEATVIQDCLDSIIHQTNINKIIVACNGCTDNTANIVQKNYGHLPQLICLDLSKPSKTHAINEAEKLAEHYPIFYIDADTQLSANAINTISTKMQQQGIELAAPMPNIDTRKSSWLVKQYYTIWLSLPYIKAGVIATCSFVVSEQGRKRFEHFPDVINDDGFIRCQFQPHEIANIAGSGIDIQAPRDVFSLIKIKTRARLGNMQLTHLGLCTHPAPKAYSQSMRRMLFSTKFVPSLVYYTIALLIRVRARLQWRKINQYKWEKDLSSRG
ncbi:MAG: glycosyltransferase family 2 protein [bacterium]